MNVQGTKNRQQKSDIGLFKEPFVCLKQPFIGVSNPSVRPFVDNKIPFVGIYKNVGFTIIELLLVIAITGILAAFALPAFQNFIKDNRLKTRASEMVSHLQLARSEAAKQKARVTMCTSTSGTGCTAGTNWNLGWIVWTEKDGVAGIDPGNEILKTEANSEVAVEITSNSDTMDYLPNGTAVIPGGGVVNFTICDDRVGERGRQITVALTGRAESDLFICP